MPAATIVGGLIAAGGAIFAALVGSSDTEATMNEARSLAETKRRDDLLFQRSRERLEKLTLKQRGREARMGARARKEELGQRKKEFASSQRERQFEKTISLINGNQVMRQNYANLFQRRAA